MAAGELVSVRAQQELAQRELQVERQELAEEPEAELRELAAMYRARGVPAGDAMTVARILSANDKVALDTHARLELGIDPETAGSPARASIFSFVSFTVGAILPLFPWFFARSTTAVVLSIVIGAVAALVLGGLIGSMAGRSVPGTAIRQLAVAAVASAVTFGVGHALGVSAT
jgi:VIT1/CCC1 family predicted Fe2+/Mn2+ transporter